MLGSRHLAIAVAIVACCQQGMFAQEALRFTRVRGLGDELRRLIQEADTRSTTFRTLVDQVQASNAIVVIQFGRCANGRVRSCVSHVEGDVQQRHIRIVVDTRTTEYRLMATIGHELQHAVEITRAPEVVDSATAVALYRRIAIGKCRDGLSERCETEAATIVEATVLDELHHRLPH